MRKLIVMMVAAAAMAANAASFDWEYWTDSSEVGYSVYVMLGDTVQTSWASIDAIAEASVGRGTVINEAGAQYASGGATGAAIATGSDLKAYFILVNGDTYSTLKESVTIASSLIYGEQDPSPGAYDELDNSFAFNDFVAFSGGGGDSDVPEPTSGVLMLVGAAMVALKRKQR